MRWRLIRMGALPGALNMAIDEAMLLAHEAGWVLPTLRLYRWSPPAVSLGLLQSPDGVDEALCRALGYDLVRRPSGGGAVLHEHEITYAVVIDGRLCPYGSAVLATYRWLSEGVIAALRRLGIKAQLGGAKGSVARSDPKEASFCFVRLTGADLGVKGQKLGGSAQARRRFFVLQHGSLPFRLEVEALQRLFRTETLDAFTCLEWLLLRPVSPDELADALIAGFCEALGVTFTEASLTPREWELAEFLLREKYGVAEWTRGRKMTPKFRERLRLLLGKSGQGPMT